MLNIKLNEAQHEKFLRLQQDGKHDTPEHFLEEMLSLIDSVYAGRRDGYAEIILRNPSVTLPNGRRKEIILVRKY